MSRLGSQSTLIDRGSEAVQDRAKMYRTNFVEHSIIYEKVPYNICLSYIVWSVE